MGTPEAMKKTAERLSTVESKAKGAVRKGTLEAMKATLVRNSTPDVKITRKRRLAASNIEASAKIRKTGDITHGSSDQMITEETTTLDEPRVRSVYGVGLRPNRGLEASRLPDDKKWLPECFEDLVDENKLQKVVELHSYLDGFTVRSCDNCQARWFAPTGDLPRWAENMGRGPMALATLCMKPMVATEGDQREGRGQVYLCNYCEKHPYHLTAQNNMSLGPSFDALNCLTDIERMLVARVHPIVQVYTARTGQTAYVGHVVNLRNNVDKWYDNLPPHPRDLPIILVSRPTREEWEKKSRRPPLVVNRDRLVAAFACLMANHSEYMGAKQPSTDNLDKYYPADESGEIVLDVEKVEAEEPGEAHAGRELFLSWLRNMSFSCASATLRWLKNAGICERRR